MAQALYPPTPTSNDKTLAYLSLHPVEFTWFHYSRTVHTFCCTCPHLTVDGRYPLRCHGVSGLSSREFQGIHQRWSSSLSQFWQL